jgi:hypothetical protein
MKDLKEFVKEVKPDMLMTSLIAELSLTELEEVFSGFAEAADLSKFYIGGYQMTKPNANIPIKVNIITGIEDFNSFN